MRSQFHLVFKSIFKLRRCGFMQSFDNQQTATAYTRLFVKRKPNEYGRYPFK